MHYFNKIKSWWNKLKSVLMEITLNQKIILVLLLILLTSIPFAESLITKCNFIPIFENMGQTNCKSMPLAIFLIPGFILSLGLMDLLGLVFISLFPIIEEYPVISDSYEILWVILFWAINIIIYTLILLKLILIYNKSNRKNEYNSH